MSIKKLIEVALPLEAINAESAREKSIRHGHPSTLHLWWSRKPTAAARGVLWASLVDDPSSHPDLFPTEEAQTAERQRLHTLLAKLVKWENSHDEKLLHAARAEITKYMGAGPLVFLDPFAGGGAIPLEAQRLGLEAHAHDLNPVAVMINKAMIEIPPKFAGQAPVNPETRKQVASQRLWLGAKGFADDVRHYGEWMKAEAFRRIGHLYPQVEITDAMAAERPDLRGDEGRKRPVIAWKWARTVKCPNPACGCEIPLTSSFVLSKKKGKGAWIEPYFENAQARYEVHHSEKPKLEGTMLRKKGAVCPCCKSAIAFSYIREEAQHGRMSAQLMAVVAEGKGGRLYLSPDAIQTEAANIKKPEGYPDGELFGKAADSVPNYGLKNFADLFTPRQLTAMTTFSDLVAEAQRKATKDALAAGLADDGIPLAEGGRGALAYGQAVGVYLAFVVSKLADRGSSLCSWDATRDGLRNTFARQAIPMMWDYAEGNPFCTSSGSYDNMLEWVFKCLQELPATTQGNALQHDAQTGCPLRNLVISSDPPYYDNIGYADLSDFFYVWLRRSLKHTYPNLFQTMLVPKAEELVATPYRFDGDKKKARNFFEDGMFHACCQIYASAREDVPVTIYYAYKQSESDAGDATAQATAQASTGWETMLSAIIRAGFAITGTWPMRTEMNNRSVAMNTNALASSIVLVCRKRPKDAPSCPRRNFLASLRRELHSALQKLQASNIAPVDMAQAAIGPGMAVFSRYASVLEADGSPMTVRSALHMINQELDTYLTEQDGDLDAVSRFCLDLYTQYAFNDIKFGEADVLARAKNTSVEKLADMGLVSAAKGLVHLKTREELPVPKKEGTASVHEGAREVPLWLLTQQLTQAMQEGGITACAHIVRTSSGAAPDRAKALAYRLYTLAEQKNWTQEAYAYNTLVAAWPEIQTKVMGLRQVQGTLG